jgi:acyl-CoA synthetase (AMP-forming)/AMP-acid ligase II
MPPARLHQVLRSRADLSSLRAVVLGGSPASPGLLRAATEQLGPIVWQGYGQGEAGVIAMLTPEERLSANSVPKTVEVTREVPLNASGKPDKKALLG